MKETPRVSKEAISRWSKDTAQREIAKKAIADGRPFEVESLEHLGRRVEHLNRQKPRARALPPEPQLAEVRNSFALERVIGPTADFQSIGFFEMALAVARTVCLLRVPVNGSFAYGTGSLVSPRILLTNNHVIKKRSQAQNTSVDLDFQLDKFDRRLPVRTFKLDPDQFFMTDPGLDFTLVAVEPVAEDGKAFLDDYGWNRLIEKEGKIAIGDPVNIIQHPGGDLKQMVLRENHLVRLLPKYGHYETDTEPGSSGAPAFNDDWELVFLHHSGVPATDDSGRWLTNDGGVWTEGMDPGLIKWVANEGMRISRIVSHVKGKRLTGQEKVLRAEMLGSEPPDLLSKAVDAVDPSRFEQPTTPSTGGGAVQPPTLVSQSGRTWTLPLTITVGLGEGDPTRGVSPRASGLGAEAISIDPDYGNRDGYRDEFLGVGDLRVRFPWLSNDLYNKVAFNQSAEYSRHVLPYLHFSVVMNRERRMAFLTAVNIDGVQALRPSRDPDRWYFDPRVDRDAQFGNELYEHNPLDRGHLVRRLDPAWGPDMAMARVANDDTFHWTNCSPQHLGFNRQQGLWAHLENYILNNADNRDLKVSVFTGPVFRDDDPGYREAKVPQQYWKVVVMVKQDGSLSATAYVVSQEELVDDFLAEEFAFGQFKTLQVPIRDLEDKIGISFRQLRDHDPMAAEPGVEEAATRGWRELSVVEDIRL